METVTFDIKEQIGFLTINRPNALNAINDDVLSDCDTALDKAEAADIRCLIVTGSGDRAFVAGGDVAQMCNYSQAQAREFSQFGNAVFSRIEIFPAPVIAAVNGYAIGGGCELALACDIRIAAENAAFALPEVSLGICPGWGGMQRLVRAVGIGKAKEIIYSAGRINAAEAMKIGLVNAVYPQSELLDKCFELAEKFNGNPFMAVRAAKKAINAGTAKGLKDAIELETEYFAACFETNDQREAMTNFLNKRKR